MNIRVLVLLLSCVSVVSAESRPLPTCKIAGIAYDGARSIPANVRAIPLFLAENSVLDSGSGNIGGTSFLAEEPTRYDRSYAPNQLLFLRLSGNLPNAGEHEIDLTMKCKGDYHGDPVFQGPRIGMVRTADAAPFPTSIGEVRLLGSNVPLSSTSISSPPFSWTPSPEFVPFLAIARISVRAEGDDGQRVYSAPSHAYGIDLNEQGQFNWALSTSRVPSEWCKDNTSNYLNLIVQAEIAGSERLESPPLSVLVDCKTVLDPNQTGEGCTMNRSAGAGGIWIVALMGLTLLRRKLR